MQLKLFKPKMPKTNFNKNLRSSEVLKFLQELGKSLQFPIAVLPFAAILNRFGALGITYSSATVDGVLNNY